MISIPIPTCYTQELDQHLNSPLRSHFVTPFQLLNDDSTGIHSSRSDDIDIHGYNGAATEAVSSVPASVSATSLLWSIARDYPHSPLPYCDYPLVSIHGE